MKTKFYTILLVLFCFVSMGWGQTTTLPYTTVGTFSWECPAGVYKIQVESWGGGGCGGSVTNSNSRAGGGGGGGSYVKNTIVNVVPGVTYTITVGAGGAQIGKGQGNSFGGSGGFSGFSGGAVTSIVASGGTGGSGGTTANLLGLGGVLGGMYGITTSGTSTGTWTSGTTTVSIAGGGGSGATAAISTATGAFSAASMTNMGTSFTSVPTVTITSSNGGGGISAVALVNPNTNAGGEITLGTNGSSVTSYVNSGAGGAGANGGAGGASVTGNVVGLAGTAPGGGGSGASTTSTSTTSLFGGVGADGKVLITYVSSITLTGSFSSFAASLGSASAPQSITVAGTNLTDVITVTAPAGFEVSSNGTDYYSSTTIGTAGISSSTLYLRIAASTGVGSYGSAGVSFVSGATTNSATCSGTVSSTSILSASELASFETRCINTTSTANTFSITGVNLTTANVTVGPTTGFTFSADGTTYSSSLSLVQSGGAYSKLIYVKFSPTSVQTFGSISVGGGGVGSSIGVPTTATAINTAVAVATGASNTVGTLIASVSGTYTIGCSAVSAYGIEFSTTSGFANGAGTKTAGGGGAIFTSSISGLSPGTLYYYKVYATDGTGTVYSSQSSFKTKFLQANSTGSFVYTPTGPLSSKPVTVYYRIPAGDVTTMPILFSFHGDDRDASNYRDYWTSMANTNGFMVFAPEFKETDYPGADGYQMGNVYDNGDSPSSGTLNPTDEWTFSIIDPLFEAIKTEVLGTQLTFKAWGHSGGAQFLQRFNLFMPNSKLDLSVCSNSGWYTVPDISVNFPYGINNSTLSNTSLAIPFTKRLIVHLGLNDTDPNSSGLRHNTTVDNQQGLNRLDRGRYFFNKAQTISNTLNYTYNWQRQEVAGVGHDPQLMANNALSLLSQTSTNDVNYTSLDGGFEAQSGTLAGGSAGNAVLSASAWSTNTTATISRAITATNGRSGPKYLSFGANGSGTAKNLYSPQIAGAFAPSTTYQIQFYYKTAAAAAAIEASTVDLYVDNNSTTAAGTKQTVAAGITGPQADWTKVAVAITTNSTVAGTNGVAGLTIDAVQNGIFAADIDDFIIYKASSPDTTPPSVPGAVAVSGVTGGADVSWSAASEGVDGGGYLVVRYATSVPSPSVDPNVNGIYKFNNAIGTGAVRYIGTSNAFTDSSLSPGTDYYYKVYTFDKAFNYSIGSQSAAVQAVATNYYYKGTGALTEVANWGTNTNGSGNAPTDFTSDSQVFEIRNSVTLDGTWTVTGTGSKVRIGNATQPAVTLTINSGASIGPAGSGNVDVVAPLSGHQAVVYKGTTAVSFGNIFDTNLEITYDGVTVSSATTKSFGTINNINGANVTFSGTPTMTNLNVSSVSTVTFLANPIVTNITVDASSTLVAPTNTSSYITIPSGGSVTINGTVKIPKLTGFVSSSVGTPGDAFGDFQFVGAENLTLGANSTVEYVRTATAAQTVTARTDYKNLTLSATTPKTVSGPTTVAGTLTINQTAPATAVTLSGDLTVDGTLSFVSGNITTSSNALTIGASGSITGAGSGTGWVIGNLKKATASGVSPSYTYAIGDATTYTPLAVTFSGNTSAAGSLTASTASGDHAAIATSSIIATKSVNRTWTLTNNALANFGTYNVNFVYASGDNDLDAIPANYGARLYNGATWSYLTITGTSTTTATAVGVSGFGDFAIGEFVGAPAAELTTLCAGATVASLSGSTSATAPKWYAAETGGSALASDLALATGTYYVSQTIDGIESLRTSVGVTVNVTSAPAAVSQTFCSSETVAGLVTSGTAPKWYTAETGGSALASNVALVSGNYYVSQTSAITACESLRTPVSVTVNGITSQPTGQTICFAVGGQATLSVVSANPAATYQWEVQTKAATATAAAIWATVADGANYAGATSAALVITKSATAMPKTGTLYRVKVTGSTCPTNTSDSVAITDAALPATAGTIVPSDAALCKYVGYNTQFTLTTPAVTTEGTSYVWTVPTATGSKVNIIGSTTGNVLTVNLLDVTQTVGGTIGNVGVRVKNAAGCVSATEKTFALVTKIPTAPSKLVLTSSEATLSGLAAITKVGPYMRTSKEFVLTATDASNTAHHYRWVLPYGVNITQNSATVTQEATISSSGIATSSEKVITVNFLGVQPAIGALPISVYSVGGCQESVVRTLTLARALPTAPSKIVLTSPDTTPHIAGAAGTTGLVGLNTLAAITKVGPYMGTATDFTLTATPVITQGVEATSYAWVLPAGVEAVTTHTATTVSVASVVTNAIKTDGNSITIRFSGNEVKTTGNLLLSVYAVNGAANSTAKTLTLARVVPTAPTALALTSLASNAITLPIATADKITKVGPYVKKATALTLVATPITVQGATATSYEWIFPAGVSSDDTISSTVNGVTTISSTSNIITVKFEGVDSGVLSLPISVYGVNGAGKSLARTLTLSSAAPATPVITYSTATTTFDKCHSTTYTATSIPGATYNWTIPPGATGTSTTNSIVVDFTNVTTALTYAVTCSATNGTGTSTVKSLTIKKAATCATPRMAPEASTAEEFKVVAYPNPSHEEGFRVKSGNGKSFEVEVFDMLGRSIEQRQMTSDSKIGSNYAKGVYNVIVKQDANVKTLRLIKR